MTKQEIKEFYEENKDYIHTFVIILVVCVVGIWLVYDRARNEPIYNNTGVVLDTIEVRIGNIEQRLDSVSKRIDSAQKAVQSISDRVDASAGHAKEIEQGIGSVEKRLDEAIQRSGRIQNLISDIENANR